MGVEGTVHKCSLNRGCKQYTAVFHGRFDKCLIHALASTGESI